MSDPGDCQIPESASRIGLQEASHSEKKDFVPRSPCCVMSGLQMTDPSDLLKERIQICHQEVLCTLKHMSREVCHHQGYCNGHKVKGPVSLPVAALAVACLPGHVLH